MNIPCGLCLLLAACGLALVAGLVLLRRQALQAELTARRMQLEPHFLFNALNAITALVAEERPAEARELTERLALLCREMAGLDEACVCVRDELELACSYIDMASIRFGERLKTDLRVDPRAQRLRVPKLILQPLVENAVKHGVERTSGEVELRLTARLDGPYLVLAVENRGAAPAAKTPGDGIGLSNTRARLRLLFGARATLSAHPLENGYRAQLRLPLTALTRPAPRPGSPPRPAPLATVRADAA